MSDFVRFMSGTARNSAPSRPPPYGDRNMSEVYGIFSFLMCVNMF